jgi:hypothetical protein
MRLIILRNQLTAKRSRRLPDDGSGVDWEQPQKLLQCASRCLPQDLVSSRQRHGSIGQTGRMIERRR